MDGVTNIGQPLGSEDLAFDAKLLPLTKIKPSPYLADRKIYEYEHRKTKVNGQLFSGNSGQAAIGTPVDFSAMKELLSESISIEWNCCNGRKQSIIKK